MDIYRDNTTGYNGDTTNRYSDAVAELPIVSGDTTGDSGETIFPRRLLLEENRQSIKNFIERFKKALPINRIKILEQVYNYAFNKRNPQAKFQLAHLYKENLIDGKNIKDAIYLLKDSIASGHIGAIELYKTIIQEYINKVTLFGDFEAMLFIMSFFREEKEIPEDEKKFNDLKQLYKRLLSIMLNKVKKNDTTAIAFIDRLSSYDELVMLKYE